MASSIIKLSLGLDLDKEEDKEAYNLLKAQSPSQRKSFIVGSLLKTLTPVARSSFNCITYILRCFTLVVSLLLVILSIHFTYDFNKLAMPSFWALLLSVALVVFTSFALTVSTYTTGVTFILFRVLWIVGLSYSVFTAFAGQYNSFRSYVSEEISSDSSFVLSSLDLQEQSLISDISELKASQKPYADLIADLSSSSERKVEYPATWRDANKRFDTFQSKIDLKQSQLDEIRSQKRSLLSSQSQTVSNMTVYTWLARLFHLSAVWIELFVLTLPSGFIDLASSILLKFSLGKTSPLLRTKESV